MLAKRPSYRCLVGMLKNPLCLLLLCFCSLLTLKGAPTAPQYALLKDLPFAAEYPRCRVDVYHPVKDPGFATLVWFHAGGLTGGEKFIPEGLKNEHIAVVAANYRLMPQVGIETCIEDAAAALTWTLQNIASYGGDPKRVFVGGHSAGAYLATMLVMDPRWMAKTGMKDVKVAGLLAISGQMITHFALRRQRGMPDTQVQVDDTAPFFHIKKGLPPILLVTGDREQELLGRHEETAYFARMLRLAGNPDVVFHELQGFDHGGVVRPAQGLILRYMREWSPSADKP